MCVAVYCHEIVYGFPEPQYHMIRTGPWVLVQLSWLVLHSLGRFCDTRVIEY